MRSYTQSHPWLTFQINLGQMPFELWLLLGETRSKCEHLAGVPLTPETAEKLHRLYLAKGVAATAAIEGNTLSAADVEKQIAGTLHVPPSKQYLQRETQNVLDAVNGIFNEAMRGQVPVLNGRTFCAYNEQILSGLELDEVQAGTIRKHEVGVAAYRGAPAADCEYLLERLSTWLEELRTQAPSSMGLAMPILRAVLAHLYIAWIHPFGDGNGRTARLIEFAILVRAGIPTPAAHLLSNHYNETRSEYYRQLDHASKHRDVFPFIRYALTGFVDGLKAQIQDVRAQTLDIVWINYVHEAFRDGDGKSAASQRRKHLLLDMSREDLAYSLRDLKSISARTANSYFQKSSRTLVRDLVLLSNAGLVIEDNGLYRANKETVRAFLPRKVNPASVTEEATSDEAKA